MKNRFLRYAGVALLALFIAGCGGDDGDPGPQGPPGPQGQPGADGKDAQAIVKISELSAEQWAALEIKGEVTDVTITSPPVVTFTLTDANGKPVSGLGDNVNSDGELQNVRFALAKLVPRSDQRPAHWVSYMVTSADGTTLNRPNVDREGTLVDNGDGTYQYTFARDIAQIKAKVDAATVTAPNDKADLGDLTYDPTKQHRLAIQISGSQAGGSTSLEKAVNLFYDFVPATGPIAKADLLKDVVNIDSCNTCHGRLAFHGGGRVDTKFCVTCHTSQRAYGRAETTSPFPALVELAVKDSTTGITRYLYSKNTNPNSSSYHPTGTDPVYVGDGEVMGNFTTLVHKIHQGADLTKPNYNYAGLPFNLKHFSKLNEGQRMCTTCHDSDVASKADLAYSQPSREACGACHDNVNFATGANHAGGSWANDSTCALCHATGSGGADIKIAHRTENITDNNPAITDGLASFTYDIKSAAVDGSNNLTIVFRILQRIAPSTTDTPVTFVAPGPGINASLTGFTGGPGFLLASTTTQDGINTPADYNNKGNNQALATSFSIANLLDTNRAANGSLSGPDANGYYTATILGTGAWAFPPGAKMRAVALQSYYTQRWGDPALTSDDIGRHAISVVKTVAGDAVRRSVIDPGKCGNCHEWLELHGGSRVIGKQTVGQPVCLFCHNPGLASSGRRIPDATINAWAFSAADLKILGEWGVDPKATNAALQLPVTSNNFKDMIHGLHAGRDRVTPWQDARDRTPNAITLLDFRRLDFPGILNNCETCHDGTTYNSVPLNALMSTHESIDATYAAAITAGTATPAIAGAAMAQANLDDNVKTPFGAACSSCHDGGAAQSHMRLNGAVLYGTRTQGLGAAESCSTCHGNGREYDAAVVHK